MPNKKTAKASATKAGRVSMKDMISIINKKAGRNVAHDLNGDNPTSVDDWIPTGSRWLDSIICKGRVAAHPRTRAATAETAAPPRLREAGT